MNKPLVVFRLQYESVMGWGAISNFITKFSEKIPMEYSDVQLASAAVLGKESYKNFTLVQQSVFYNSKFKAIGKPDKIYENYGKYDYAFFISIEYEQLFDVVDLLNLYLICDACREFKVAALISGTAGEYYATSHFFSFLTEDRGVIYESVFFMWENIKHLQLNNIGVLSKFLPLVPIDASEDIRLHRRVDEFVSTDIIQKFLKGQNLEKDVPRILQGAFRLLFDYYKKAEECEVEKCADYLGGLNVLSFLLFCFSLKGRSGNFLDFREFRGELHKITSWSNGCVQLIENIVFHSKNQRGAFSFRILEGSAEYIKEKYSLMDTDQTWIEMMIVDYAGCSQTWNMAETFRKNLENSDMKKAFANLKPKDFFVDNEKFHDGWKAYYSVGQNVVNHYGLKIFQKEIQNSKGHFIAHSFSSHHPQKGEVYYSENSMAVNMPELCLPGTSYSILFPIDQKCVSEGFVDYGIEDYEDKIDEQDQLFDYKRIYKTIPIVEKAISPQEKIKRIDEIVKNLIDEEHMNQSVIIIINAANLLGDMAEVVYKAMLLTLLQSSCKRHLVLYECQPEFVQMFLDAAYLGWSHMRDELNYRDGGQIVLYTADYYEEIVVMPKDWRCTQEINRFNNFSRETRWKDYFEKWQDGEQKKYPVKHFYRYPFDILAGEEQGDTVFEKYVQTVIERNIQGQELGCKLENTHMRLGSTIHVNHFYEAEILFGNSLFVERFALLVIKRMLYPLDGSDTLLNADAQITLYGYTNYSEQTVFCTMQFLKKIFPGIDVDYAILERESEERGFTHVDRIRYSYNFESGESGIEKRRNYFQSRKIVCIIPIASTLKTNEKMINLFLEENGGECKQSFWRNFELILVGSIKENKFWKKDGKRIVGKEGMEISPIPEFFVEVLLDYMEPLECEMCFPPIIIDEQPLIEVNAASTIPNQAFGLICEERKSWNISPQELFDEEKKMEVLQDLLIYRHLERNENHYLFYFQTEHLVVKHPEEVQGWLKEIRGQIQIAANDYIILFCPAHFSNAGFIEYVNTYVFGSVAVVIRDDVDKEYRCNFRTKFSNLRNLVEKIVRYKEAKRKIRLFYVDDCIITGRTFQRARSLAQSVMEEFCLEERQKYIVFEGIFVLIDRNSKFSRWQYTGINEEEHLYAFRTVQISSIRNHGDACVYCNLAKEAETLKKSSVTKFMGNYWKEEAEKFSVMPIGEYFRNQKKSETEGRLEAKKKERAFRRLVCTNNSMIFLDERYHGNDKEHVLEQLLMLILTGSRMHTGEEAEYFLSYCKVMSRPFRVFDKTVKEAVFDFLLVTSSCTLSGKGYDEVIAGSAKKQYLQKETIKERFLEIEKFVKEFFSSPERKQDLLKVLLKQLTEMKSNFIIRESIMGQILNYADLLDTKNRDKFVSYYKYLIKKLTGVSSDTSKSLRLDRMLCNIWRGKEDEKYQDIYLENVWIYQDAFQKLNERVKQAPGRWAKFLECSKEQDFKQELMEFSEHEIAEYLKPYQFKDFISLLQLHQMCDDNKQLTKEGKVFVAANLLLYHFIAEDFESGLRREGIIDKGNLAKVDYIASCMRFIMDARKVVIAMEFDVEYDLWESIIVERYNKLLPKDMEKEKIAWERKKEYIILGSNAEKKSGESGYEANIPKSNEEKNNKWTIREKTILEKLKEFQKKSEWMEKGYAYDKKFFLWELGHDTDYPVYIFAEWEDSGQVSALERLNRIRGVMQYYWQLNHSVFHKGNEGFFYEIAQQRKKNAIHSRQKTHTHTKSDIKLGQYDHMLLPGKYNKCYQSDLLMLLADLNVSDHYRNSLTAEYYLKGDLLYPRPWNNCISPFLNQKELYVISSETAKTVKMIISDEILPEGDLPLREDEKIVAFDNTNGERDVYLLLYSLMANAATNNRGKIDEKKCVTVYYSRTPEGMFRILNQTGENLKKKHPQQIMEELEYPPEEENQGISMWSISRYTKGVIACILDNELKKLEKMKTPIPKEGLALMKQRILQLLGDEFKIKVEELEINGKNYFSVSIPVLAEKYEK